MRTFILIFLILFSFKSQASPSSFASSVLLRQTLKIDSPSFVNPSQSIVLPLSPGLDQKESVLCWTYATLSLLESNLMLRFPQFENVSFSRTFMQRNNAEDRAIKSYILKEEEFKEFGTMSIALKLIKKYGLIPQDGRPHPTHDSYAKLISDELDKIPTKKEKFSKISDIVDAIFFKTPSLVVFNRDTYTPKALGAMALNGQKWLSFAFEPEASGKWGTHPDTDAYKDMKAWYVDPAKKENIIKESLKEGFGVAMFYAAHIVVIYGADYDEFNRPVKYYIKDSYPHNPERKNPYTYEADPAKVYEVIKGLDTIDIRSKIN
jgi:hypothetical protein